ncbi:MAG: VWA domain-containing protein [Terriglobales bacterium]|jgi:VWFA-related protein
MRRRNNAILPILLLTTILLAHSQTGAAPSTQTPTAAQQDASAGQTPTLAKPAPASPDSQAPAANAPAPASSQPAQTGAGQNAPAPPQDQTASPNGSQSPESGDSGVFVFKKEVEEVVLHATVVDNKQHIVTNLGKNNFSVFEDGRPQTITSFRHEDIPVAMCIVVDNSGSMREKREKVNAAALNLVRASNPNDEVCIVNFNDEYYLDQDFTSNINKLKEGLEKIETRGGTALYDAVVASAVHLKENAKLEKKVIFVVTDGDDNESSETLEQAVRRLQTENGPTVYAIGILEGEEHVRHARRALQVMCERTGGIAFLPRTLDEVDAISRSVAHDIRSQYTIGYKPSTPRTQGGYREVKVDAKSDKHEKLTVRTKSGYYAGPEPSAGAQ